MKAPIATINDIFTKENILNKSWMNITVNEFILMIEEFSVN